MPRVELVGGFYEDSALQFSAQNCINMYPEYIDTEGVKGNAKLKGVVGLTSVHEDYVIATFPDTHYVQIIDFHLDYKDRVWAIYVKRIATQYYLCAYRLDDNEYTEINITTGGLGDNIRPISVADNGYVISVVVSNGTISNGYFIYINNPTITINKITDTDYPPNVIGVEYKDTYFLWLTSGSTIFDPSRMYISDSYADDYTNCVNAIDFTTIEIVNDNSVAIKCLGDDVLVFGTKSIQYFYNSGNVDFPFDSNKGVTQNIGTSSPYAIEKIGNTIIFIGQDNSGSSIVYKLNGYQIEQISNHAIENKLNSIASQNISYLEDIVSYSYQSTGHYFYCLKIASLGTTLCYDMSTNKWHERQYNTIFNKLFYPVTKSVYSSGKNYTLDDSDYKSGSGQVIRISYFDDSKNYLSMYDGESSLEEFPLHRTRTLQHLSIENRDVLYKSFELDIQKGVANVDDPDPTISISMSKDGGMTYGTAKVVRIGGTNTKQRIRIKRLGRGRDIVFKIESSSPVQQEWFTAYVEYEALND